MAQHGQTVLVADSSNDRRRRLGLALYEGGFEVINAVNGEEALRFTAGLNPALVVAHTGLSEIPPLDLRQRLEATGLKIPPFLVLYEDEQELSEDRPEGAIYYLQSSDLDPHRLLQQVRLLLLAREIGGELGDRIDVLYGDLTRVTVGELLRVLSSHLITGHVILRVGVENVGFWVEDGEPVHAHWGPTAGMKAFNRIAGLRGGGFVLEVGLPEMERTIDKPLAALVSDAVDESLEFEEVLRKLPSLQSKVELHLGDAFFNTEFSPVEKDVFTHVQGARNLGELIDRVSVTDLEVVRAIARLEGQGLLKLDEPKQVLHVVTDSTADLQPDVMRRYGITVVPLSVLFGRQVFKDGVDLHPDQFYRRLQSSPKLPTTSPPSQGEFREAYSRLIGTGDIISVHISSKLSETLRRAQDAVKGGQDGFQAARRQTGVPGDPEIRLVDSWFTSVGLGMIAVMTARMARRGLGVNEVAKRLEDIRRRGRLLFVVDTLDYLQKGGRIGRAQALLGTLLGIKPILHLDGGEVAPLDKVRGGRNAQPRLIELIGEKIDPEKPIMVSVAHASAPKWGGRLRDLIAESFNVLELMAGEIGPIVGTHVGPGCVGAYVFQPTDEEIELLGPGEG